MSPVSHDLNVVVVLPLRLQKQRLSTERRGAGLVRSVSVKLLQILSDRFGSQEIHSAVRKDFSA